MSSITCRGWVTRLRRAGRRDGRRAVVVMATLAFSACSTPPAPDVVAFAIDVTGSTDPGFHDEAGAELAAVTDVAVERGAHLLVVQWAGTPKDVTRVFDGTLRVGGSGDVQKQVAKKRKREETLAALRQLPPRSASPAGTDVFGSLFIVAGLVDQAARGNARRVLIVRTDGENISELVDLRAEDLADPSRIPEILDLVEQAGLLPRFAGTDTSVYIVGVGRGGEGARSSVRARQYQALYAAWCARTGADHCVVDSRLQSFALEENT